MSRRAALLVLFLLGGCAAERGPADYVVSTRAQSQSAEEAAARGDDVAAVEALEALLAQQVPAGLLEDDARVIRQDAHDRMAQAQMRLGDLEAARASVAQGLALGEHEDLFTANLLTTRGRIAEAEGRDNEAARDYHQALGIHEALLDEALGGE